MVPADQVLTNMERAAEAAQQSLAVQLITTAQLDDASAGRPVISSEWWDVGAGVGLGWRVRFGVGLGWGVVLDLGVFPVVVGGSGEWVGGRSRWMGSGSGWMIAGGRRW